MHRGTVFTYLLVKLYVRTVSVTLTHTELHMDQVLEFMICKLLMFPEANALAGALSFKSSYTSSPVHVPCGYT